MFRCFAEPTPPLNPMRFEGPLANIPATKGNTWRGWPEALQEFTFRGAADHDAPLRMPHQERTEPPRLNLKRVGDGSGARGCQAITTSHVSPGGFSADRLMRVKYTTHAASTTAPVASR